MFKVPANPTNPATGQPYSEDEYWELFRTVANKKDWKLPIKAKVHQDRVADIESAIVHFTGSSPRSSRPDEKGMVCVVAEGYYSAMVF